MEREIRNYSQYFRVTYPGPPPQLPSTWRPASEVFRLPSYDEAIMTTDHHDSHRLPNYSSRQLGRHHPYWQYKPSLLQTEDTTYQNTIFDEHCVPLEVPALVGPPYQIPPLVPWGVVTPAHAQQSLDDDEEFIQGLTAAERAQRSRQIEEKRWTKVWSLRAVLRDFYISMHRARSERPILAPVTQRFIPMPHS